MELEITFNGKKCTVKDGIMASDLLLEHGYKSKTSIWVNGAQLLKSEDESFVIPQESNVKALRVVGGGWEPKLSYCLAKREISRVIS